VIHDAAATPRARRRDQNLQRILDTAMQMVERGGLEALSINRLAEAVDYTPGALYRYVDSKDALLSKLVARVLEDVRAHLDRAIALLPVRASPLARVFVLAQAYRAFARREPRRFGLLATTMAEPRVLLPEAAVAEPVAAVMIAALQPLAGALEAAAHHGQLSAGDVAERTICVFALLQGVLLLHKQVRLAPAVLDLDRLVTRGTRALLLGWGASPRALDGAVAHVTAIGDLEVRLGGAR
jgi:AcrR family transcriptional regulator